jgi:hypothetical protein
MNIIYGLIDPRTNLIRYVGLSSRGMRRPKDHRRSSCPESYCRRWVKTLQKLGLDYEITVLEVLAHPAELSQAERWWIAFGRACGWPLTNCTDGGGFSEEVLAKRLVRKAERARKKIEKARDEKAAVRETWRLNEEKHLSCSAIGRELIEKRKRRAQWLRAQDHAEAVRVKELCFKLFEEHFGSSRILIDVVIKARVTIDKAEDLYHEWLSQYLEQDILPARRACQNKQPAETIWAQVDNFEAFCTALFEQGRQPNEIANELNVKVDMIVERYNSWLGLSYARGKRALEEERRAFAATLKASKPPRTASS